MCACVATTCTYVEHAVSAKMAMRKFDEWDVSEIEESQGAAVHGVITNLSTFNLVVVSSIVI